MTGESVDADSLCVANAIYYEARGEPLVGQRAVYDVIRHRADELGLSYCGVVTAKKQFSWYGKVPLLPYTGKVKELYEKVKSQPRILTNEKFKNFYSGVRMPYWAKKMKCKVIGQHKFCAEKEKKNRQ